MKTLFGWCAVERACCFFGHKDTPESVKDDIYAAIEKLIVEYSVDTFYVGNHGRFDFYTRAALRQLQEKYPIHYSVVLAYMPGEKTEYDDFSDTILPEGIEEVHPKYATSWRNDWLLRESSFVIACIHHNWGGAARYVQKAYRQGKKVINLCQDTYFEGEKLNETNLVHKHSFDNAADWVFRTSAAGAANYRVGRSLYIRCI